MESHKPDRDKELWALYAIKQYDPSFYDSHTLVYEVAPFNRNLDIRFRRINNEPITCDEAYALRKLLTDVNKSNGVQS